MSLKKKSVLGLSYLTMALLGASVLMANPVSADEEEETVTVLNVASSVPTGIVEVGEIDSDGSEVILNSGEVSSLSQFEKARTDGYEAGYEDGKVSDTPEVDRNSIDSKNYSDSEYDTDYKDAYEVGHYAGWKLTHKDNQALGQNEETSPSEKGFGIVDTIYTTIQTVWEWITYIFS